MRVVLDASAVLEYLLDTEAGSRIRPMVEKGGTSLNVPHLTAVECAAAVRSLVARDEITDFRARGVLEDFAALRAVRWPHEHLLPRVWELRGRLTAYDAIYVALAEELGAVLLTTDARLARGAEGTSMAEIVVP